MLGQSLHCPQTLVQHLIRLLAQSLQPKVHFGFAGMRDAIAYELHLCVSREYCSQQVAEGVILIVEHIGGTAFVVLFLEDHQSLLTMALLLHFLLHARLRGDCFLLFGHVVIRFRHCVYYMLSTLLEDEIYLGYAGQKVLEGPTYQSTFVGGRPVFLRQPAKELLTCETCIGTTLTFICQVFCPFQVEHCYNRVLYLLFCERCQREFRCIKQQISKGELIEQCKVELRSIQERSLEVDSQNLQVKELQRVKNKAKREIQEEVIEQAEQEEFDSDEEQIEIKQVQINLEKLGFSNQQDLCKQMSQQRIQQLKLASQGMQQTKKQQKDLVFEQYRKIMKELDGPILLYTNIPIPYNSQPINPRHFCKHCNGKLTLELQITQKILLLSPKLVALDWGTLMVFTCPNSCPQSTQQCVVVQYQKDAVQDIEVKTIKKRQKNRKRKEKSSSKREQNKSKEKKEALGVGEQKGGSEEQGDWD